MKFWLILFFSFFIHAAMAEIKADLSLPAQEFKEGDLIEGTLKVWPLENAELSQFQDLENKSLGPSLIVSTVESAGVSPNNADVVEIKMLLAVKTQKEANSVINYQGQSIPVAIPAFKVQNIQKSADFVILDQGIMNSQLMFILTAALILAFILLVFMKRASLKKLWSKIFKDQTAITMKKYNQLFSTAILRSDYEKIYALRKEWHPLVKIKAQAYDEFFKVMEEHQYKKDWGDQELNDVKRSFDIIRGSFK